VLAVTENNLGTQPQTVLGTQYAWPEHDQACDLAFKARNPQDTIRFCKLAVDEYNTFFQTVGKNPDVSMQAYRQMEFNEAYTESVELAAAYDYTKDRQDALLYATDALRILAKVGPSNVDDLATNASELSDAIRQHYPELEK